MKPLEKIFRHLKISTVVLFSILSTVHGGRSLYVNGFNAILGDTDKENNLLAYAQSHQINKLLLYNLHQILLGNLSDPASSLPLANFIIKAKTQYGIQQMAAVGENADFFGTKIQTYNNAHAAAEKKFDAYNLEFEFWNETAITAGGYYCTTYLTPNGFSCDRSGAFQFYMSQLSAIKDLAAASAHPVSAETYVGWPSQNEAQQIAQVADHILVHAYRTSPETAYGYTEERLSFFAGLNQDVSITILYSAEPDFMQDWLLNHGMLSAEQTYLDDYYATSESWKSHISLDGFCYFSYSHAANVPLFAPTLTCTANTLEELVGCIATHMPLEASNGYDVPTATELQDWQTVVSDLLTGGCDGTALPASLAGIYSLFTFTDQGNGITYGVAMENADADGNGVVDHGWGTLILNPAATLDLVLAAPHSLHDSNTGRQAVALFKRTQARAFLMNGAHRYANDAVSPCQSTTKESDVAHNSDSFFHATTRSIAAYYAGLNRMFTMVQCHGMGATSCPGVDVYMTYGNSAVPEPWESLSKLKNYLHLLQPTWVIAAPGDGYTCSLSGGTNIQGRLLNGVVAEQVCTVSTMNYSGRFIHMEQKLTMRQDGWFDDWAEALTRAFAPGANYYVDALNGSDSNHGLDPIVDAWRTLQHAVDHISAGDTLNLLAGTFTPGAQVTMTRSGTAERRITIRNHLSGAAIIDAAAIPDYDAVLLLENVSYVNIHGLRFQHHSGTYQPNILIYPGGSHLEIHDCIFQNSQCAEGHGILMEGSGTDLWIHHNQFTNLHGSNINAIGIYGTGITEATAISDIVIENNLLNDLHPAQSEAIALNGNVKQFVVRNNVVENCNNIGIVAIGGEDICPVTALDRAREGRIAWNDVSYCRSSYGGGFAAGIYIDGGVQIVLENNRVHHCDLGIEVGAENNGVIASLDTVRNNLLYKNDKAGLAFGGYDYPTTGKVDNCLFIHNTLYDNDLLDQGWGQLWIQYAEQCLVRNNILVARNHGTLLNAETVTPGMNNSLDYALWHATAQPRFVWNQQEYTSLDSYRAASGQDGHSQFALPRFEDETSADPDFHLATGSPAIDAGDPALPAHPGTDMDHGARIFGNRTDQGADEYDTMTALLVKAKTWLQGAVSLSGAGGSPVMTDALRTQGLVPLTSPYHALGWDPEAVTVTTWPLGPDATPMVDWIFIELYSDLSAEPVAAKSAFIDRLGRWIDVDANGWEGVVIPATPGSYHVVVRHRNHLRVISATAIACSGNTPIYDFTPGPWQAVQGLGCIEISAGVWAQVAGDIHVDGHVTSKDYVRWYNRARAAGAGYWMEDINFDGIADQADFELWRANARKALKAYP